MPWQIPRSHPSFSQRGTKLGTVPDCISSIEIVSLGMACLEQPERVDRMGLTALPFIHWTEVRADRGLARDRCEAAASLDISRPVARRGRALLPDVHRCMMELSGWRWPTPDPGATNCRLFVEAVLGRTGAFMGFAAMTSVPLATNGSGTSCTASTHFIQEGVPLVLSDSCDCLPFAVAVVVWTSTRLYISKDRTG